MAMGKIVVCAPNHPSNDFFKQFPNCRTYDDADGFVEATLKALKDEPAPLTDDQRRELSWEAATERFLKATQLLDVMPVNKLKKTPSKLFASSSISFSSSLEDVSALMHFMGTGFVSEQPNEAQCKELGLPCKKQANWEFGFLRKKASE